MFRSVAIMPSSFITAKVFGYKQALRKEIGWYQSANADAHLSVNNFAGGLREQLLWLHRVERFCQGRKLFTVRFDRLGIFAGSGTIYLAPDLQSRIHLTALMKEFHMGNRDLKALKTFEPHLTIARKLSPEQLNQAVALFSDYTFDLGFTCDRLCIRKLNESRGQYELESTHVFGTPPLPSINNPQPLYLF